MSVFKASYSMAIMKDREESDYGNSNAEKLSHKIKIGTFFNLSDFMDIDSKIM